LAHLYVSWDRHAEAEPFHRYVDEHSADLDDPFVKAFWSWYASRLELWAGRLDVAIRKAEDGRPATEDQVFHRKASQWNEAHARATKGEYETALSLLEATLATCERVGELIFRLRCLNTIGYVYSEIGDLTHAMSWNQEGLEAARAAHAPVPEVEMNARLNLAENLLSLGRLDEAAEHFRIVESVVRHPLPHQDVQRWRYGQRFLHDFGEYWLARGDPARALSLAGECLAWAERTGSRKNIAKARRLTGQCLQALHRLEEAEEELAAALDLAQHVGSPPQIWKTWLALGDLRAAQGRAEEAQRAYQVAVAVVDETASRLTDPQLRQTFLASGQVQAIRRRAAGGGTKS
jgi:tetratricopeptide (TPR) repeat protein